MPFGQVLDEAIRGLDSGGFASYTSPEAVSSVALRKAAFAPPAARESPSAGSSRPARPKADMRFRAVGGLAQQANGIRKWRWR